MRSAVWDQVGLTLIGNEHGRIEVLLHGVLSESAGASSNFIGDGVNFRSPALQSSRLRENKSPGRFGLDYRVVLAEPALEIELYADHIGAWSKIIIPGSSFQDE